MPINNFKHDNIIILKNFLDKNTFNNIRNTINKMDLNAYQVNGSFRKGSAISFDEVLNSKYRNIVDNLINPITLYNIYKRTKLNLQFIEKTDKDIMAILYYNKTGDNIGWHHDRNIFHGNRWAAILTIVNTNKNNSGYSSAKYNYKINNKEKSINTEENSLLLFRGDQVLHKVEQIKDGEKRIVIAMVLCDVCKKKNNIFDKLYNQAIHYNYYGKF